MLMQCVHKETALHNAPWLNAPQLLTFAASAARNCSTDCRTDSRLGSREKWCERSVLTRQGQKDADKAVLQPRSLQCKRPSAWVLKSNESSLPYLGLEIMCTREENSSVWFRDEPNLPLWGHMRARDSKTEISASNHDL